MGKPTEKFFAAAIWDDDEKVFYSVSNIKGLHIVSPTIAEFEAVFDDVAAELILANHITPEKLRSMPPQDLVNMLTIKCFGPNSRPDFAEGFPEAIRAQA